jgi:hypothetical protein
MAETLLLAALATAPRRFRQPPLPPDARAAAAQGIDTGLAFAMEAARVAVERNTRPGEEERALFLESLAALIAVALAPEDGDPTFQSLVLRAQEAQVAQYVRLSALRPADHRAVRSAANAIGHPGKTRGLPAGPLRAALESLHRAAAAADGDAIRLAAAQALALSDAHDEALRSTLESLVAQPAVERLSRLAQLTATESVQRYLQLARQNGPAAGSAEAAAQGRAAARVGNQHEANALAVFGRIAALLNGHAGFDAAGAEPDGPAAAQAAPAGPTALAAHESYRAVRGLRTPPRFPGEPGKAKDEWDVALVRRAAGDDGAVAIALLAEVKAAPAAATPDFARLLRGLERLALADPLQAYAFSSDDGVLMLAGDSLRRLAPNGRVLPPHVVYCCGIDAEAQPQVVSPGSKAVLLAEPPCIAFAQRLQRGAQPSPDALAAVWHTLLTEPRLRSALYQHDTARAVREAMLHPDDLMAALQQGLASASRDNLDP